MISQTVWNEIKDLPPEELWKLIKDIAREAKGQGMYETVKDVLCPMLEILKLNREILRLENELAVIERMIGDRRKGR